MAGNVTLGLAGLAVLLLLVLIVLVLGLRRQLAELAAAWNSRASRENSGQRDSAESQEPLLHNIGNAVVQLHEQIASFDVVFSDMQEQLSQIGDGLQDIRAGRSHSSATAAAPPASPALQSSHAIESASAAAFIRSSAEPDGIAEVLPSEVDSAYAPPPEPPPPPVPAFGSEPYPTEPTQPAERAPVTDSSSSLINEYRQLIAEPRKNEINRWVDERGGMSCMVSEDGTIFPLTRDAGGLLVVLRTSDGTDLLVPGGRMAVEFATSFASPISMRSVTRDCFELIGDGTGILRLLEPARIRSLGEGWSLVSPGQLSGFTS